LLIGPGNHRAMTFGTSILLAAVGAILRYAVTAHVSGISLATVGLILMIAGGVGFILSLLYLATTRRGDRVVAGERVVERDPYV